jgi:hypothetical protein
LKQATQDVSEHLILLGDLNCNLAAPKDERTCYISSDISILNLTDIANHYTHPCGKWTGHNGVVAPISDLLLITFWHKIIRFFPVGQSKFHDTTVIIELLLFISLLILVEITVDIRTNILIKFMMILQLLLTSYLIISMAFWSLLQNQIIMVPLGFLKRLGI